MKGIGGHHSWIIGIAEGIEVTVGKLKITAHFWVARGPTQIVLAKPFLIDVAATINYARDKGESLIIKNKEGQNYLVPISTPTHQDWETTLPVNQSSNSFLSNGQKFQ